MLEKTNKKPKKEICSYLQFFLCWWPNLTPTSHACFNIYLNLVDYTTWSAMVSQWTKYAMTISSWASLVLLISLDMTWSKPVWIVVCPLFKEGHNHGGILDITNAWARELWESFVNWTKFSWTSFFPTFWEFFLSKRSWIVFCIIVYFSQVRLYVHPWPLEKVGNHYSCMWFRPDSSTP